MLKQKRLAMLAAILVLRFVSVSTEVAKQPAASTSRPGLTTVSHPNTSDNVTPTAFPNQTTSTAVPATTTPPSAAEFEHQISLTIFFILVVIGVCILVVHVLITTKLHYLPESIAVVLVGAAIGLLLRLVGNWRKEEAFPSTLFLLVLLPPIIFESGYNLHKGNFFHNIGSIIVFAVFGTVISAAVIGGGLYLCGIAKVAYPLTLVQCFTFGSLISAVDPVATLAIFQAMDIDPILYMLVFGESILNDAVSIVLMNSVMDLAKTETADSSSLALFGQAVGNFMMTFLTSAGLGIVFGLASALLLKFIDLRRTPSLEVGMMLIFSYAPYCLAEGIHLSGIMAILFAGIVMSHYTHLNLSPVTQITVQQTFRTVAFVAETGVFAYLGMAIFSFKHRVEPALVSWCFMLCLVGRACNIFPLSYLVNHFREHKITIRMQLVMWFSGLRGAIAFALALHLEIPKETREVLVTTTLIVVLTTILLLGGGTMPMVKFLNWLQPNSVSPSNRSLPGSSRRRRRRRPTAGDHSHESQEPREVSLSKTKEMGETVDSETAYSEYTESEWELLEPGTEASIESDNAIGENHEVGRANRCRFCVESGGGSYSRLRGFMRLDVRYLIPIFTRRFTSREVAEGRRQMSSLTDKWFREVRSAPSGSEDEKEGEDGRISGARSTISLSDDSRGRRQETQPLLDSSPTSSTKDGRIVMDSRL